MRNTIKLSIKGLNFNEFLNYINKQNIQILFLRKLNIDLIEIKIYLKDFKVLKKYVNYNKFEVTIIEKSFFYNLFSFFKLRLGLLVGMIFFVSFLIINSFYINKIEVNGLEHIKKEEIVSFLNEKDVKLGTLKSSLNQNDLKNQLLKNFELLSKVSLLIKGNTIVVNVKEKIFVEELQKFSPIVANEDGIIKDINLVQGTLNCKKGDLVKKGDILVFPFVITSNFEKIEVQPKATIKGDVYISSSFILEDKEKRLIKTDNFYIEKYISIGNFKAPVKSKTNNFENIIEEITVKEFSKNNILPIKIIERKVYEAKFELLDNNINDLREDILNALKKEVYEKKDENQVVNNENYDITYREGKYYFTYTIEMEKVISNEN